MQRDQRLSQHSSKNARCRTNAVVFQKMNQFAKAAIIASVSNGPLEWPLDPPASGALSKTFCIAFRVR